MAEQVVSTLVVEVAGRKTNLEAMLRALQGQLQASASASGRAADLIGDQLAQAQSRAATEAAKLAQAQSRAEAAATAAAAAEQKLARAAAEAAAAESRAAQAAANMAAANDRAAVAALRRAQVEERAGQSLREASGGAGRLTGSLGELAGTLIGLSGGFAGIAVGLAVAGQAMLDTAERARQIQLALGDLDDTQLRAVSDAAQLLTTRFGADLNLQMDTARVLITAFGTDGRGAMDIMAAGFENGLNVSDDFLDTLKEYAPQFAQLGFTADQTLGIIQRGLAAGARDTDFIGDAIKEFNIKLRETATIDALTPLDSGLAAIVQRFQDGQISAQEAFQAIAAGLAAIEDPITQRTAGVALMGPKFEDLGETAVLAMGRINESFIATDGAAAAAGARIESLGEIGPRVFAAIGQALQPVNDALLAMANGIVEAEARLGQLPIAAQIDQAVERAKNAGPEVVATIEGLRGAIEAVAASGETGATAAERLLDSYRRGAIDAESLSTAILSLQANQDVLASSSGAAAASIIESAVALAYGEQSAANFDAVIQGLIQAQADEALIAQQYADRNLAAADATLAAADAATVAEAAAYADAAARLEEAAAAELTALRHDELDAAIRNAAAAGGDAEAAARAIASQFNGVEAPAIVNLINLHRQLAAARANAAAAKPSAAATAFQDYRAGERTLGAQTAVQEQAIRQLEQQANAAARAEAERLARTARGGGGGGGGSAGRSGGGGGGSAGRSGGGGAARSGPSQAEREAQRAAEQERRFQEQRLKDQEQLNQQIREAEAEHYERLLDIQAEFEEKSLAQQRKNEVSKRRSRYDFYNDLTAAQASGDLSAEQAQALSAQYEAAFAESQRLAQEGNQQLAAEYLALKQEQIQAEQQFQEQLAAAREKGDKAELARLEQLATLRREAEQAELDALLAEGDRNVKDRDDALTEESQRYEADQQKIAEAAETAAQRKIESSAKSKAAIEAETAALKAQADLLEQLNRQKLPAGSPPPGPPAGDPTTTGTPQPLTAPTPSAPALPPATDFSGLLGELQRIARLHEETNRRIGDLARALDKAAAAQRSAVNKNG